MSKIALVLSVAMVLGTAQPDSVAVSEDEQELHRLVNDYRQENGLPEIPLSKSLTHVAQVHVADLVENNPVTGSCNMHSWSDQSVQSWDGWTPCCYTPDHANAECMWEKPRELTAYTGSGYENAYTSSQPTPEGALNAWKSSPGHNDVILNEGSWANLTWRALGVGMNERYGVLWFGSEEDPSGNISSIEKNAGTLDRPSILFMSGKRLKVFVNRGSDVQVQNIQGQRVTGVLIGYSGYLILDFANQSAGLYWVRVRGAWRKLLVP